MRADAALGRAPARLHARVHDLRRAGLRAPRQALHRGAGRRSQALHAAGDQAPDLRRQEPAARRGRVPREGRLLLRADRRRRLRALRAAGARDERHGLRRPARPHGQPARALPGGSRPLPAQLPARARGRVPGHEPRPVPLAADPGRGAPQPGGGRRRCPVDLRLPWRGHPQHPRLRGRLPRRRSHQARAELPLDADDPLRGECADREQPLAEAQGALDGRGPGRSRHRPRARGRARGGALRRRRDRAARGRRRLARRGRGLLPRERAEPRAGGHARPVRRRLPGHRRHPLLRAGRDQGRARLPDLPRQPARPRRVPAHRQLAAARHRRHHAGAHRGACEHDRRADLGRRLAPRGHPGPGRGGDQGGRTASCP